MNDFESKHKSIKDRVLNILERDRRDDTLESLIHNYSKEKQDQEKILLTREEFFKEKENK